MKSGNEGQDEKGGFWRMNRDQFEVRPAIRGGGERPKGKGKETSSESSVERTEAQAREGEGNGGRRAKGEYQCAKKSRENGAIIISLWVGEKSSLLTSILPTEDGELVF